MIQKLNKFAKGISLLDIVLALALFGIFATFIVNLLLMGQDAVLVSGKRQEAVMLTQEGVAALANIAQGDFGALSEGSYSLSTSSNQYNLVSSTIEHIGIYDRKIDIKVIDFISRAVTITVSWMQNLQRSGSISMVYNIYNWSLGILQHSGRADFNLGLRNSVKVSGEGQSAKIILNRVSDWSRNYVYRTYDMTGTAAGRDVAIFRNYLYVMQDNNTTGAELTRFDIDNMSTGEIKLDKTWKMARNLRRGYFDDTNSKAYFASLNTAEIVYLDLLTNVVTTVNVAGTIAANDVWGNGNKVFMVKNNDISYPELEIYNTSRVRIGSQEIGANATMVVADDHYAYVTTGADTGELMIIDHTACSTVSPFTCPIVRQYDLPGTADATSITKGANNNWFIGRADGSLYGLTINSPTDITQNYFNNSITAAINDLSFDTNENLLMVATANTSLAQLYFVNMTTGQISASNLTGTFVAGSVVKYGSFIYTAGTAFSASAELQVVRALGEGWDKPLATGVFNTSTTIDANQTYVSGNTAYMVTNLNLGGPEFYIIDSTNPALPVQLGSLDLNLDINDVFVVGNYAYLATSDSGRELIKVDISNKSAPFIVASLNLPTNTKGTSIGGDADRNLIFIGTENNTTDMGQDLYVVDASGTGLKLQAGYDAGGSVNDIDYDLINKYLYLATSNTTAEMQVIDVSNSLVPVKIDSYDSYNSTVYGVKYDSDTKNSYLTLANSNPNNNFYMLTATSTSALTPDWSKYVRSALNGTAVSDGYTLKINNGYAYLGTKLGGSGINEFFIIDISNANFPIVVGSTRAYGNVWDMKIAGDYAYLATDSSGSEIRVINIKNKTAPMQVGLYDFAGSKVARSIEQMGTITYVGLSDGTLAVINFSDVTSPVLLGSVNTGGASLTKLSVASHYVVASVDSTSVGLLAIDVVNPSNMTVIGTFSGASHCLSVNYESTKERAILGCQDQGTNPDFYVVNMHDLTQPITLSAIDTGADNRDIFIWGNNAYVATSDDLKNVKFWDITNSITPINFGYFDALGSVNSVAFDGSRIYLASDYDAAEFQVGRNDWQTTPILKMIKGLNLSTNAYSVIIKDEHALVTTAVGLAVIDTSTEINPQKITANNLGLTTGAFMDGRGYLYLSTADDNKELQIFAPSPEIRGFVNSGSYSSTPYNSGLATTRWKYLSWSATSSAAITFQIRTAPDTAGQPGAWSDWLGPVNAADSYLLGTDSNTINPLQSDRLNDQWLQYRAFFKAVDSNISPELNSITIYYD